MKKFMVMFMTPAAVLASWAATDETTRKDEEAKMKVAWDSWMATHKDSILEIAGLGGATHISKEATTEVKNDMMMYALMQAESKEAVTAMLAGHVHLTIPESSIEVMETKSLLGN